MHVTCWRKAMSKCNDIVTLKDLGFSFRERVLIIRFYDEKNSAASEQRWMTFSEVDRSLHHVIVRPSNKVTDRSPDSGFRFVICSVFFFLCSVLCRPYTCVVWLLRAHSRLLSNVRNIWVSNVSANLRAGYALLVVCIWFHFEIQMVVVQGSEVCDLLTKGNVEV